MQLTYPWFLVGLLAIAIPIVIHLLQLRRPQRLFFTNTAFIKAVELITMRHRNLQQLLILLARVLALLALVLVFCQPFIPAKQYHMASGGADVLVDNSYSMQARSGQGTLFGQAVKDARYLGKSLPGGGMIRLVDAGNGMVSDAAYQRELDRLRLVAQNPFSKLMKTDVQMSMHPLYVFSDFQKNSFDAKAIGELGSREVVLVPQVSQPVGNVYVDSVWLDDAFVRVRANVGLHVRLRNGGLVATSDCPVKVFLGARQAAAFRVTVEPGQVATSVVQVQVSDVNMALGRVVTEDAPVTFDNTYYFTLQPAAAIRVLEIGAEPVLKQLYANEPLFTYSFVAPQHVDYGALQQANLVVMREVKQVDAGLREALRAVVKRRGSVVVVPPTGVSGRDSYQQLFKELGVGAAQWEAPVASPELREVAMPGAGEPFFRNVFGAQQRAVTMPRVAPVLRWTRTGNRYIALAGWGKLSSGVC